MRQNNLTLFRYVSASSLRKCFFFINIFANKKAKTLNENPSKGAGGGSFIFGPLRLKANFLWLLIITYISVTDSLILGVLCVVFLIFAICTYFRSQKNNKK